MVVGKDGNGNRGQPAFRFSQALNFFEQVLHSVTGAVKPFLEAPSFDNCHHDAVTCEKNEGTAH